MISNYLGVDLESWARSPRGALARLSSPARKVADAGTIVLQTRACLELLHRLQTRATFFITSEIFDWYPGLVEEIAQHGHELGFHTHCHEVLRSADDLIRALEAADQFLKIWKPKGFRAPALWMPLEAYAVLAQAGFSYSSSVYGESEEVQTVSGIVEVPVSTHRFRQAEQQIPQPMTLKLWLREIPFGSGYFLALFGWRAVDHLMRQRESHSLSSNLFIHSWQLFAYTRGQRVHHYLETVQNPLFLPYARIIRREFVEVVSRHRFTNLASHPTIDALGTQQRADIPSYTPVYQVARLPAS